MSAVVATVTATTIVLAVDKLGRLLDRAACATMPPCLDWRPGSYRPGSYMSLSLGCMPCEHLRALQWEIPLSGWKWPLYRKVGKIPFSGGKVLCGHSRFLVEPLPLDRTSSELVHGVLGSCWSLTVCGYPRCKWSLAACLLGCFTLAQ